MLLFSEKKKKNSCIVVMELSMMTEFLEEIIAHMCINGCHLFFSIFQWKERKEKKRNKLSSPSVTQCGNLIASLNDTCNFADHFWPAFFSLPLPRFRVYRPHFRLHSDQNQII